MNRWRGTRAHRRQHGGIVYVARLDVVADHSFTLADIRVGRGPDACRERERNREAGDQAVGLNNIR